MGLILNQLGQDNFATDSDQSPLASPPWNAPSGFKLEVATGLCTGTFSGSGGEQYAGVSLGNDQYASVTIADISAWGSSNLFLAIRASGNGSGGAIPYNNGYELQVYPDSGEDTFFELVSRISDTPTVLASGHVLTPPNNGDVWTLAAVGTTLYVLQNGIQVASVTDSTFASGFSALAASGFEGQPYFSNFATGDASVGSTYSISGNCGDAFATVAYTGTASGSVEADGSGNYVISGLSNGTYLLTPSSPGRIFDPTSQSVTISNGDATANFTDGEVQVVFLGTVCQVASAPAGQRSPYLGRFTQVSAAPGNVAVNEPGNVFLGSVILTGSTPPAGFSDGPPLGTVVIVESVPAGAPNNPFLGTATTS
jgi:hypothetical protein